MIKILWKDGPYAGQTQEFPFAIGTNLIANGQAVEVLPETAPEEKAVQAAPTNKAAKPASNKRRGRRARRR